MKKILKMTLILGLAVSLLLPSCSLAANAKRYVQTENGKSLNVRDLPGKNGSVIFRLKNGSRVTVLEELEDWVQIEADEGTGYVQAAFLMEKKPVSPGMNWVETSGVRRVRTGNKGRLHLRRDASSKSESLGLYANGTEVKLAAVSGAWAKVNVEGQSGYMLLSCLTAEEKAEEKEEEESPVRYIRGSGTVPMYGGAGTETGVLMRLPARTEVRFYAAESGWARITVHGQAGYVRENVLTASKPAAGKKTAIVVNPNGASYVNLRSSASLTGTDNVLAHVKVDTEVEVVNRKKSWVLINVNGTVGYVHRSFLIYE